MTNLIWLQIDETELVSVKVWTLQNTVYLKIKD